MANVVSERVLQELDWKNERKGWLQMGDSIQNERKAIEAVNHQLSVISFASALLAGFSAYDHLGGAHIRRDHFSFD